MTKNSSERFKPLTLEEMTPAQRRMAENLLSGPRKGMRGPFSALLYSPEMGDAAQELGARVRFKNSLPDKLKELAILTVARFWTAQFEWYAHQRLALEAGRQDSDVGAAGTKKLDREAPRRRIGTVLEQAPQAFVFSHHQQGNGKVGLPFRTGHPGLS